MTEDTSRMYKVSQGDSFAVHNYFHVSPESPNGQRITYALFPGGPHDGQVGPCGIMVCDRDGGNQVKIGAAHDAQQHTGARQMWLDDQVVAYVDRWQVHLVNVDSGEETVFRGGLDNYSPALNRIYFPCPGPYPTRPGGYVDPYAAGLARGAYALDLQSGQLDLLVSIQEMAPFDTLDGVPYSPEAWRFAHTYPSPTGAKIAFAIFVDAPAEAFVFTSNPDGSEIKPFGPKPMHWTFYDDESLFGHDDKRDIKDKFMRRWDLDGNILEVICGLGCHGTLSPDKQWIVTESWYGSDPTDVWLYRRGETTPRETLATQPGNWQYRSHVHPAFSRDGQRVYFNYNATGSKGSQVYVYDLSGLISG